MTLECRTHTLSEIPEIEKWVSLIENGEVPACAEQIALCEHVRKAVTTENLFIDAEKLARYKAYSRYFPWSLAPEQEFLLALWLCTYTEDGLPRWPELLLYVCRGWGKTSFAAYLAFCLISPANGIEEYDVDICATVESQAKIGYDDLWRLFEKDPELFSQGFTWNKVELYSKVTGSRFKYWSGNSRSKDGMRSGAVFFDEEHAYEDSASMAVFTGGLGKKQDPRRLITTTDGFVREGPLDEDKARARRILFDGEPDNGFLPFMCKLDSLADADDERMWAKANPRLLRSKVLLAEYRREVVEWKNSPSRHPEVPTKRFNLPEARRDIAVTTIENLEAASRALDLGRFSGKVGAAGIDYAKTTDMVGACVICRDLDEWLVCAHAWWCTESADAGNVRAPLAEWAARGLLTIVDGPEVPPEEVAAWVRVTAEELGCTVHRIGIDSYRFALMRKALIAAGFDPATKVNEKQVWQTRPSDIMRVQPIIDSAFANKQVVWGDSPLMRWATNNAKLEPAPNNCFKFGKIEPHGRKTDPFMAMVHAFVAAETLPEQVDVMNFMQPFFF